jgi:hypothetical protein
MDEILAHAKKLKPIAPELNLTTRASEGSPRDSSLVDSWGRRDSRADRPYWTNGNCLRLVIATMRRLRPEVVPDPAPFFSSGDGWLQEYDATLQLKLGLRLEEIPHGGCPPIDRRPWIAVLESGQVNHAVLAREHRIVHDPNGRELGGLEVPRDRLLFGLRLVPADQPRRGRWGEPLN